MHRYVYPAFGGILLGIAWRSVYDFGWSFIAVVGVVAMITGAVYVARIISGELVLVTIVALTFFTLGMVRMHVATPTETIDARVGSEVSFEGVIVHEPDVRESYTNLVVETDDLASRLLVRAPQYTGFSYKDDVRVKGILELPENFEGDTGRIFNYRGYLAKDSVYYTVAFPEVVVLNQHETPTGLLLNLKHTYLDTLKRYLPEPSAALAGGITVGERRSLGEELTQAFRDTGLIHIVVLSGYNIAIIVIFISALLAFLPEKPRFVATIAAIVLFTVLVGASATVVRAALMGSIGALGAVTKRTYSAMHALIVAGFVMLLWNPYLLLYDPSFQLSFIATLGLLLGVPLLVPHLAWVPEKFALRELMAATISTQIAVLPLLAYMVGSVSLVALVVNALVLPIIPFAMLAVFLVGVVGSVSSVLVLPFSYLAHRVLLYVIQIVELFAALPFAKIALPEFSLWWLLVVYVLYALFYFAWKRKVGI